VEAAEAGRAVLVPSEQGATGLLRATVPAAFGRKVVMPIIPGLLAENPGLSIDLELSDGVTDLISRGMDVAIRIAPLRDSGLIVAPAGAASHLKTSVSRRSQAYQTKIGCDLDIKPGMLGCKPCKPNDEKSLSHSG
jgi:DNA-binding transcriptional LysR family regulator